MRVSDGIGIGSEIWRYDENRRVYAKDGKSGPIYREKWHKVKIIAETSRSWITSYYEEKVPKKGVHTRYVFSECELEGAVYVHENRYKIIRKAERINDAETWRRIAQLVNYEEAICA